MSNLPNKLPSDRELTNLEQLVLEIVAATNDRGITKQGIKNVIALLQTARTESAIEEIDRFFDKNHVYDVGERLKELQGQLRKTGGRDNE